jgi:site-specific DNA recombinase
MKLLAAIRLSVETEATTSPERQRKAIQEYADTHGHTVAAWATDLDVSGKVPPRQRPELGPWLARPDEWDGLIVARLDRLARSLLDFETLRIGLERQGKAIICLDPMLDFTTPQGKAFAYVLMAFAEMEREAISTRVRDAYHHIRNDGGYSGGTVPFGYRPVRRGKGWAYEHDPQYAPIVREMAERVLAGHSLRQVSLWLNAEGVPTSRTVQRQRRNSQRKAEGKDTRPIPAANWTAQQVRLILLSPAVCGLGSADGGKVLKGADHLPVQRCAGIITREEWERVKAASAGPPHATHRADANPMLRVAFCGACAGPLYITATMAARSPKYRYYRCRNHSTCRARSIQADLLEAAAGELFLEAAGDNEIMQRTVIPAGDHAQELADLEEALAGFEASAYARVIGPAQERLRHLRSLPNRPASFRLDSAGETFKQRWTVEDQAGRRRLMALAGFRVMAAKDERGWVTVLSLTDAELARRARAAIGGLPVEPVPFTLPGTRLGVPVRMKKYVSGGGEIIDVAVLWESGGQS